ncbi:MAG: alpha-hydroxy-acid oxidizing protein [Planctomycetaceae bacterium]
MFIFRVIAADDQPSASPSKLLNLADYEAAARCRLTEQVYGYYANGADNERTLQSNCDDFRRLSLKPHLLQGVAAIDPQVTLFGKSYASPLFVAPTAMQKLAHPEGELAMARAAEQRTTTMILSTASTYPMEDIPRRRRRDDVVPVVLQ